MIFLLFLLAIFNLSNQAENECSASLKPQKLAVVGIWRRQFDNSTWQYRISDEDLEVRGYERTESDKASSIVMLARHPEGCVISKCGIRLSALIQKNGAILHTDHQMIKTNDSNMYNAEDEFYCSKQKNGCGADVPIYRLVKHSLDGPHYAYSFGNNGQSIPLYEKEYFPLCFAWRQTPSIVVFNSSDEGVCLTLEEVKNGKITYSSEQTNIFSIGTTASLNCLHGFDMSSGSRNLLCTKNGWYPKQGFAECVEEKSRKSIPFLESPQSDESTSSLSASSSSSSLQINSESCSVPKSILNGQIVYSAHVMNGGNTSEKVPTATRASVLCNIGHVPTTSIMSSNCINGKWQPSLPSCISIFDIQCPILSAPNNGELIFKNQSNIPYRLNSVITLKCDRSFFGIGNLSSTCLSTGWSHKIGHCEPVGIRNLKINNRVRRQINTGNACTAITSATNGNILYLQSNPLIPYSSGTTAYLMCNLGFQLLNSVSSLCQNGIWTPNIGTCSNNINNGISSNSIGSCNNVPTVPINGYITYSDRSGNGGSHSSGSTARLECNTGYSISGTSMITCTSGMWSPLTLGNCILSNNGGGGGGGSVISTGQSCNNPIVLNGLVNYNSGTSFETTKNSGTIATLICNPGYSISGSSSATCLSGQWSPILGTCQFGSSGTSTLQCTSIIAPLYGTVTYSSGIMAPFSSGTIATATCTNGGKVQGSSTSTCQNGMWSPSVFGTCSLINTGQINGSQCSAISLPIGAQSTYSPISLSTTSFSSGTIATVTCTSNGQQLGTSTCQNGIWLPQITQTCSSSTGSTQCIGIPIPTNGQLRYSDESTAILHQSGSSVTLTCINSATIIGSSFSTCTNGVWSPTIGSCSMGGGLNSGGSQCLTPPASSTGSTINYSPVTFMAPFTSGTIATITCPIGQRITGSNTSTCSNGIWSPTLGTCSTTSGPLAQGCTPLNALSGTISNGQMTYTPSLSSLVPIGTSVNIICFSGFSLSGNAFSTCTSSGWSPSTIGNCVQASLTNQNSSVNCLGMSTPRFGSLNYSISGLGPFPSGTLVTLICDTNYSPSNGSKIATCQNGNWSTNYLAECQRNVSKVPALGTTQCLVGLPPVLNGNLIYSNNRAFGPWPSLTVATVTCNAGSVANGILSSTCQNGVWVPSTLGTCNLMNGGFGINNGLSNGFGNGIGGNNLGSTGLTPNNLGSGSIGTNLGNGLGTNLGNGLGTNLGNGLGTNLGNGAGFGNGLGTGIGSSCPRLADVLFGTINYSNIGFGPYPPGTSYTIICNIGYRLMGSASAICTNGMWSQLPGVCVQSILRKPPIKINSTEEIKESNKDLSTKLIIAGNETVKQDDSKIIQSSTEIIEMSKIANQNNEMCSPPIAPAFGEITFSEISINGTFYDGTTAALKCNLGYKPNGASFSTCQKGSFRPIFGKCINGSENELPGVCVPLSPPKNSRIVYIQTGSSLDFEDGTTALLYCEEGYAVTGSATLQCQGGQWEPNSGFGMCDSI